MAALTIRKLVPSVDIEKRNDETQLQYHKRLIYGKLVDRTLSDIDYTELSEMVYGQAYSSDVARRMMYGSRRTLELMDKERASDPKSDSILTELDSKVIELRKERQRLFDQRREYNKLISSDGRKEHLYDSLIGAANKLNDTVGSMYINHPPRDLQFCSNEAVLVFSDWHYGMNTDNIFNKYSSDICKQRVKSVVEASIQRILLHSCSKLHIVVLGDLFHGSIHTSARVASEELVCDQIMEVAEILAQSISELSQYVCETVIYMTYGNHARTVQNKKDSIHRDNLERLIPWWLNQRLATYDSINIAPEPNTEFLFIEAAGHEICASHGDLDSVKSSPRLLTTLFSKKYNRNIEYILLGDKHHRESFEELGVTSMICGSLCGTDDYANEKRLYSTPSQMLLIVNPDCGIDAEYRIECK